MTVPDNKQTFPLFDILYKNNNNKDICNLSDTKKIIKQLKELEVKENSIKKELDFPKSKELCYAIIRLYALKHDDCKILDLPYQSTRSNEKTIGMSTSSDITIDFKNLPSCLKHMIKEFIIIHNERIDEEIDKLK